MQLRNLAIWLAAFSAILIIPGCKTAPKLHWMIVDPSGFVDKNGVVLSFNSPDASEESCISPDDTYFLLKACKKGVGAPTMVICSFDLPNQVFGCSNDQVLKIEEVTNWSCITNREWSQLLDYCKRKPPAIEGSVNL